MTDAGPLVLSLFGSGVRVDAKTCSPPAPPGPLEGEAWLIASSV